MRLVSTKLGLHAQDGSGIGSARVNSGLLEHAIHIGTSPQKSSGVCMVSFRTQQKVHGVAVAIGHPVQGLPLDGDLDVGSANPSARPDGSLLPLEHGSEHRHDLDRPARDTCVPTQA